MSCHVSPFGSNISRRSPCHGFRLTPGRFFDHAQSELPDVDGGAFQFLGSNPGNLPEIDQDWNDLTHISQPLAASEANSLPELEDEATGVDNLSCDFSRLPKCDVASIGDRVPQQIPQCDIPAIGGSSTKRKRRERHASILKKTQHVQVEGMPQAMDSELLPELPAIETPVLGGEQASQAMDSELLPELPTIATPAVGGEQTRPAVGRRQEKRAQKAAKAILRLASKSIPWRSLPYLRVQALDDIRAIADLFGNDLGSLSPPADWLEVGEARRLLKSLEDKQWWRKLGRQGKLEQFIVDGQPLAVFLMEIFSGCGNLTFSAALQGMQVAPSVDCRPGQGHADSFLLNLHKALDRRIVWALIVWLNPQWIHIGFPCTFWIAMAHWTRIRDLDANEQNRLESLAFIVFARQVVHYQASRWRHASLENPSGSQAWNLDLVQDMISFSKMGCVETDLCPWGSKDPSSGKYYQKRMQFSSTFNMGSLTRWCPKNHEHDIVQGVIPAGPCKGKRRSTISGQYPLPLCKAWVECAKSQIGG